MSKFGELIDANIPLLLSFYADWNDPSVQMHAVLRDVAAAMEIGRASCRERV